MQFSVATHEPLLVICICIKCPNLFNKFEIYLMQFSVSACESCMLGCVLLDCNGIKCTGNGLSIPAAAFSQQLLRKTSHRLLFLCLFGLFTPWYECVCDRFDCRQCCDSHAGIFKWIFDDPLWKTVRYEQIFINMGLLCTLNVQHSVWES